MKECFKNSMERCLASLREVAAPGEETELALLYKHLEAFFESGF